MCKYNNCKKNINSNFNFCQNHKFQCNKNNFNIRILKENYFCSNHRNTNSQNMLYLKNNIPYNI